MVIVILLRVKNDSRSGVLMEESCLVMPVGVTWETVEGLLRLDVAGRIKCVLALLISKGYEDKKKEIIGRLGELSGMLGATLYLVEVSMDDLSVPSKIYRVLAKERPARIIVSGLTGSRYLLPIVMQALLFYGLKHGVVPLLVHGVEGNGWRLVPMPGYTYVDLKRSQRKMFQLIYSSEEEEFRTNMFMKQHHLGRSAYKVLRKLREKGLIETRRNRIRKTIPGKMLYLLLKEAGEA